MRQNSGYGIWVIGRELLTVNSILTFDVHLAVGSVQDGVTVLADPPMIETGTSSYGATILPQQIEHMPL